MKEGGFGNVGKEALAGKVFRGGINGAEKT